MVTSPRRPSSLPRCASASRGRHPRPLPQRSGTRPPTAAGHPRHAAGPVLQHRSSETPPKLQERARRASDVINIINFTSKDNPPWPPQAAPPRPEGTTRVEDRPGRNPRRGRIWTALAALAAAVADFLPGYPRRWGDRWYTPNDEEACWRGWQITRTHGGLGRRYRDPAFDTLAECARCRGAGVRADVRCAGCQGTGRISLSGVS